MRKSKEKLDLESLQRSQSIVHLMGEGLYLHGKLERVSASTWRISHSSTGHTLTFSESDITKSSAVTRIINVG